MYGRNMVCIIDENFCYLKIIRLNLCMASTANIKIIDMQTCLIVNLRLCHLPFIIVRCRVYQLIL